MSTYDSNHRRVKPSRESTGSDLYTVTSYDAIAQTCDLSPMTVNQRGKLMNVPICQAFGGAWERQIGHKPAVQPVDAELWGNAPRGPRWGVSLPIQPGDVARVAYVAESMSDPVITGFYRWGGNYGIPWVANQVLGKRDTHYSQQLPPDDGDVYGRYDLLLPTGAWTRSGNKGSWTMATAPVHLPKAWMALDASGKIRLRARSGDDEYDMIFELDAEAKTARLSVGPLNSSSHIEIKDGDIVLRAKRKVLVFAEEFKVELRKQDATTQSILAPLARMNPADIADTDKMLALGTEAAGKLVLSGHPPALAAAELFKSPLLQGDVKNKIADLALGGNPLGHALSGFVDGMDTSAIASQLTKVIGAQSLTGSLEELTSKLDLGKLSETLNIPSWIGKEVQAIASANPLQSVLDIAGGMQPREMITEAARHLGSNILDGADPAAAREAILGQINGLPGGLGNIIQKQLPKIGMFPFPSGADVPSVAQRLGAHILEGNDDIAGPARIFDSIDFDSLGLGEGTLTQVKAIASQVERAFSQNEVPGLGEISQIPGLDKLIDVPKEIRGAIANLEPDLHTLLPKLAGLADVGKIPDLQNIVGQLSGLGDPSKLFQNLEQLPQELLGQIEGLPKDLLPQLETLISGNPAELLKTFANSEILGEMSGVLNKLPTDLLGKVHDLPEKLMGKLKDLKPEALAGLMGDPEAAIDQITSLFGGLGGLKDLGIFRVRSIRQRQLPALAKPLAEWEAQLPNVTTGAPAIERYQEYGTLDMPDFWGS